MENNKRLKVAICVSGFIRTWEYTKESFKTVLCADENVDFDLFINLYKQNLFEHSSGLNNVSYTDDQVREMFKEFNVKKLVTEDLDEKHNQKLANKCTKYVNLPYFQTPMKHSGDENAKTLPLGYRIYNQLRQIYKANKLRKMYEIENNMKYDLVVKVRCDMVYYPSIFPSNFDRFLDGKCHLSYGGTMGWPEDLVAIGTPEAMDAYQDRYKIVDTLFETGVLSSTGLCAHGTIAQSLAYHKKEYIHDFIQANILRAKNLIHIPYNGSTVEVSDEDIKNPNLFGVRDSYIFKQRTGQL